ncbi:MAG: GNAT family N-acyltransferase [Pseudomonadota bacterium]
MKLDFSQYEVRLAQTPEEIASAQRLRYRVFVDEMGAQAEHADHARKLESDPHDAHFDHLILIDHSQPQEDPLDRVRAVYRLLPGSRAAQVGGFYSASEYDLSILTSRADKLLELGRSCVAPSHRGGAAMHLMWSSLAKYVLSHDIETLFGVASFHGTDLEPIAHALARLKQAHLAPEPLRVQAHHGPNRVEMSLPSDEPLDVLRAVQQIPPLIKAYLRLGGYVGDGAFIDRDFNTIDVCLVMDTRLMADKYRDFYTRAASQL